MMERVKGLFTRLRRLNFTIRRENERDDNVHCVPHDEYLTRALGRFESFIVKVQKILVWESPFISCMCIGIVNLIFWLALSFQCRFYGVLFTTILIGYIYNVWIQHMWPEISIPRETNGGGDSTTHSPRVLSVTEISCYMSHVLSVLKDYYIWLKTLRDTQPGLFCCGMCTFFILLTVVGRTVPGLVISYCLIMFVMIGPGIWIHLLHPPTILLHVSNFRAVLHSGQDTDSEVEEYLPEQTGENLALLQLAGEANEEEQHEESLIIAEFGLEAADMSSMLTQDEGSTDGLDISEFDLSAPLPKNNSNNHEHSYKKISTVDPDASDTDEDDNVGTEEQIQFQNLHFNRDSSEEEELAFAHGLAFTETNPLPSQTSSRMPAAGLTEILASTAVQAVTNIASVGAMGRSLLSTVIGGTTQVPVRKLSTEDSSSGESEGFEMVSHDDFS